ncbi:MAG: hypothetical protein GC154_14425 [bacterium]|nr:hypothetical protein [bacterium]
MKQRIRHILFQRHLLWEFLKRDLQSRYLGTAIGLFWSVVNPLIMLVVYATVFGWILKARYEHRGIAGGGIDFAFYIFSGLLPWFAFQESLMRMTTCIVDNSHLIKQVRFPAKTLPAYLTLSSLVNQAIGSAIFFAAVLIVSTLGAAQCQAHWTWLALPLAMAIEGVFFFGLGLLFSTMHTYFRDVGPMVSVALMVIMWGTPMLYTINMIPEALRPLVYANPATCMILIHHDLMLFGEWPGLGLWLAFIGIALASLAIGYAAFTRNHADFADLL